MAEPHMPAEPLADGIALERQPARAKLPLRVDARRQYAVADFPGCRPVRISRDEIDSWEGRFELWDARTEIAMVAEPATTYHEYPSQRLAHLTAIIAHSRGSSIDTLGTAALPTRPATTATAATRRICSPPWSAGRRRPGVRAARHWLLGEPGSAHLAVLFHA